VSIEWIKRNPSQAIGFVFAGAAWLLAAIALVQEEAVILGADVRVFVVLGAVLLGVTIIGRVWQKLRGSLPVDWGVSSIVGFASALVAELVGILTDLSDALEPLGIPPAFWYSTGVALAALTKLLRYAQATDFGRGPDVIVEPIPTEGGADETELEDDVAVEPTA
jgi:hypothetical protein